MAADYLLYVLEVELMDLMLTVQLNDISIFSDAAGTTGFRQIAVNPYVVEGTNTLAVWLGRAAGGAPGAEGPTERSMCKVRLYAARRGEQPPESPTDDDFLAVYRWTREQELPAEGVALVWTRDVSIPRAHGRWDWQDARPYEDADRGDVLAVVRAHRDALAGRDVDTLMRLNETRIAEYSRALDMPLDEMRLDQEQAFTELFAFDTWTVPPLDEGALVLVPAAGGRLVQVFDPSGETPLRGAAGDDERFAMDANLSRTSTGWTLVR